MMARADDGCPSSEYLRSISAQHQIIVASIASDLAKAKGQRVVKDPDTDKQIQFVSMNFLCNRRNRPRT